MIRYLKVILGLCILEPLFITAASAQVPPVAHPAAPPAEEKPADKAPEIEFKGVDGMKSLFFTDEDIQAIRNARKFYEQHLNGAINGGIAEDDFLKNLEKINAIKSEKSQKDFTYPQFFLASIAYHSPKDWVVWINNEKITQDSGVSLAGLRILSINENNVTIEWQPENMDRVVDDGNIDGGLINVDIMRNKVVFTLKANQTFTSYAMKIVEGKVPPVTVNLNSADTANMLVK